MKIKMNLQLFASDLKGFNEKRNALIGELESLIGTAETETRALTQEENEMYEKILAEIKALEKTIGKAEEQRNLALSEKDGEGKTETRSAEDIVDDFVKGRELRAGEMSTTENGNVIPQELSSDIIKKVTERSDVFNEISLVKFKGIYKQIIEKDKITAGWTDELSEVLASKATFDTVDIGHHKLGSLAKISLELVNQSHIPVTGEITTQMVDAFSDKLEEGIFNGTGVKQPEGLKQKGTEFNLASSLAITADEVVSIFHKLNSKFLKTAKWYMNRSTLEAIRKLKDGNDRYLFADDLTKEYVGYILGKPVMISDSVEALAAGTSPIFFGDVKQAYKGNSNPDMFIQILRERYIDQGAIGVIGFLFFDGKVVNEQAYVNVKAKV